MTNITACETELRQFHSHIIISNIQRYDAAQHKAAVISLCSVYLRAGKWLRKNL